jgi:HD domain
MLEAAEAQDLIDHHLGATPRAAHSRFVGSLMGALAEELDGDSALWTVVGPVHDLDFYAVGSDFSKHGILVATWLADQLPAAALEAIAAHDHRTGVESTTVLATGLRLADALAVLDYQVGREAMLTGAGVRVDHWQRLAGERTFLATLIKAGATDQGVTDATLAKLLSHLSGQE